MAIGGIGPNANLPLAPVARAGEASAALPAAAEGVGQAEGSFGNLLGRALADAHASADVADDMQKRFAAGDPSVGLHEVMIASEKAGIELRYATTLKNKAIEAYRELMNTPL